MSMCNSFSMVWRGPLKLSQSALLCKSKLSQNSDRVDAAVLFVRHACRRVRRRWKPSSHWSPLLHTVIALICWRVKVRLTNYLFSSSLFSVQHRKRISLKFFSLHLPPWQPCKQDYWVGWAFQITLVSFEWHTRNNAIYSPYLGYILAIIRRTDPQQPTGQSSAGSSGLLGPLSHLALKCDLCFRTHYLDCDIQ